MMLSLASSKFIIIFAPFRCTHSRSVARPIILRIVILFLFVDTQTQLNSINVLQHFQIAFSQGKLTKKMFCRLINKFIVLKNCLQVLSLILIYIDYLDNKTMSSIDVVSNSQIQEEIKKCISDVSSSSKYQHKLIFYFGLLSFMTSLQIFSTPLLYMNPAFECEGQDGKISEEDACFRLQSCSIVNTQTFTALLQLYCGSKKHDRTLLQTTNGIGSIIGIVLVCLSDRIGKKYYLCGCLLFLNISWMLVIAGAHLKMAYILFVADLISSAIYKGIYIIQLVLLTRFLRRWDCEWATILCLMINQGISQIALAAINTIFLDWRAIVYFYSAGILGCSIAAHFIIKEDPVFLFEIGKIAETKRIIEEVGYQNEETESCIKQATDRIDYLFEARTRATESNQDSISKFDLGQIMRCDILQKIFILGLVGFFYFASNSSIMLTIQSLENSYNFNFFIVGLACTCGFASATIFVKKQPHHKRGVIYTSILYAAAALLMLFPFCNQNGNMETVVIFSLRFLLCWTGSFYTRLKVDSFPEKYQVTIISLIQFSTNMGTVVAAPVVQVLIDQKMKPIPIMAILRLILGTLPVFFLVEKKISLDSIQYEDQERPIQFLQEAKK